MGQHQNYRDCRVLKLQFLYLKLPLWSQLFLALLGVDLVTISATFDPDAPFPKDESLIHMLIPGET